MTCHCFIASRIAPHSRCSAEFSELTASPIPRGTSPVRSVVRAMPALFAAAVSVRKFAATVTA